MADIAMMWVGKPISKIQTLAMTSFIKCGHRLTVYLYDQSLEVPKGVIKADANEIVPESEVFLNHDTFAAFADVFRYQMIAKTGQIWSDADNLCLRDDWDFDDYIFGYQEPDKVTNGVLSYPQNCELSTFLIENAKVYPQMPFDGLGPLLVTRGVTMFNLEDKVLPQSTFYAIPWTQFDRFWLPSERDGILEAVKDSHAISLWNYMLTFHKYDKDNFPSGSAMDYWWNQIMKS